MLASLLYLSVRVEPQPVLRNGAYSERDIIVAFNQSQNSSKKLPSEMVLRHCQLDRTELGLEDKPPAVSVRMFPKTPNREGKTHSQQSIWVAPSSLSKKGQEMSDSIHCSAL